MMTFWIWFGFGMSVLTALNAAYKTHQAAYEGKKDRIGTAVLYGLMSIGFMLFGTASIIVTAIQSL